MRRSIAVLSCIVALSAAGSAAADAGQDVDVARSYGVTAAGMARAISDAKGVFARAPNTTVVLHIAAGVYDLSAMPAGRAVIDFSGVSPGAQGRLVVKGDGADRTTLVFNKNAEWIFGRNVSHLTITGLHMTASQYTTSQGHVVSAQPGAVVLAIDRGFPSPADLFDEDGRGRYLRRYTDTAAPQVIETNNDQAPWTSAEPLGGSQWRIDLKRANDAANYKPGDFVCIKSKPGGNTFFFLGGSDIVFDHVKWTQKSRGVFRGGASNIRITNSSIERPPPINGRPVCLATPGGGPQIGQPGDPPTTGDVVSGNNFTATGDDSIALFNASGEVRNNAVSDSFARCILLRNSPNVTVQGNSLGRCRVEAGPDR